MYSYNPYGEYRLPLTSSLQNLMNSYGEISLQRLGRENHVTAAQKCKKKGK